MRRRIVSTCLAAILMTSQVQPAHAFFGLGRIVLDPSNLAQNISTATNTVRQINNQIRQLQNEAQMILNQVEDLRQLDFNSIEELLSILDRIDDLMRESEEISYEVAESERRYQETYPDSYEELTNDEIVTHAIDQWRVSRETFAHSIRVQSGIVTAVTDSRTTLGRLVAESQAATGNLAVNQAGNQLMALSIEQQMQMQQLMASHYRMMVTEQARRNAIEEQSRVLHERFRGDRSAYARN
ncbi:MAG: P-type conjugative transfer protein TrbJ [Pseudomonadota bacterium]